MEHKKRPVRRIHAVKIATQGKLSIVKDVVTGEILKVDPIRCLTRQIDPVKGICEYEVEADYG